MTTPKRKIVARERDQRALNRLLLALGAQFLAALILNQMFAIGFAIWLIICGVVFMGIVGGPPQRVHFFGNPNHPQVKASMSHHPDEPEIQEWFPADLWVGLFPVLIGLMLLIMA